MTEQDPYYGIDRKSSDRAVTVLLSGDLDINARDDLRDELLDAVAGDGVRELLVDFDQVAFMDSEAMGALLEGVYAARAAGVRLRVANLHGTVRRVFEVSGVREIIERGPGG